MEMAAHGWIGMTWPTEYGGGGRPDIDRLIVGEELIAAGAPIAAMWFADRQMGPTLINYGTADQQAEFLPGMLSGETTWCIGMSEPDSGSDLASLTTSAPSRRRRLRHQRTEDLDVVRRVGRLLLSDLPNRCRPAHRTAGISEVIVPMNTPGIEVRPITDMTTNRHFCEVWFSDVRVPVANLVGVEGNAFKQTMAQLEHERGGIDRLVSNRALYELAVERADRTDPRVRQEIAADRDRLHARTDPGDPRGAPPGPTGLLRRHEVLLHRASATCRVVRRPHARRRRDAVGRRRARAGLRSGVHDHGRNIEHHAQHPRRAGPRTPPRTTMNTDEA